MLLYRHLEQRRNSAFSAVEYSLMHQALAVFGKINLYCTTLSWCYNCAQYYNIVTYVAAAAGQDYTGGTYTATFLPGLTTSSVSIPIINDNVLEVTEFFTLGLSIPPTTASLGVSAGSANTATVNIVDNDSVAVQFNPTQYTVTEGDGEVVLTLVANASASFDYTVQVDTSDGAAEGRLL